jgi:N-acetylmuramic acid 6-phosphate etherase
MPTETADPRFAEIESLPLADAVRVMWEGQRAAIDALETRCEAIAKAAEAAARRLRRGKGRLVYAGAGTSGRVAVQDGVELVPTFGWEETRLHWLLAGGDAALAGAVEGAEDDAAAARAAVAEAAIGPDDVLIAVAASGRTPFTCAAAEAARNAGAQVIGIANNAGAPLLSLADHAILAETGAEVIAGSTRMQAGTAQRATLTLLSTAIMIALGRVHRGRMIAMRPTNAKLRDRARRMVAELAEVEDNLAVDALARSDGDIATAVLIARGASREQADVLLVRYEGRLADALAGLSTLDTTTPPH